MSKKYKEELDKIVMSEDMKKRILHNVLNENLEAKSNEIPVKKYGLLKRNMQMIAACFAVVACVSAVKNNPQILKVEDRNMEQEEMHNGKDGENEVLPSGQVEQSDDVSKNSSKSEEVAGNNSEARDISKSENESNNKSGLRENISKNENESSDVGKNNEQITNFQNGSNKGKNIKKVNNGVRNDKIDNDGANSLENNSNGQAPKISNGHSGNDYSNGKNQALMNEGNDDKIEVSGNLNSSDNSENTNSNYNGGAKSRYDNENSPKEKQKESSSGSLVASSNPSIGSVDEGSVNENTGTQRPIQSDNGLKGSVINKDEDNNVNKSKDSQPVMGGSPIKEYKTLEEAEDAVKFKISTIESMLEGFNIENISVISDEVIEITYKNSEQDVINFRAGKEIENISGDYNTYRVKNTVNINGISVALKGSNNKINLAAWKKGGISYSIYSINGRDEEEILNMISSSL